MKSAAIFTTGVTLGFFVSQRDEPTLVVRDAEGHARVVVGQLPDEAGYGLRLQDAKESVLLEVASTDQQSSVRIGRADSRNQVKLVSNSEGSEVVLGEASGGYLSLKKSTNGDVWISGVDQKGRSLFRLGGDGSAEHSEIRLASFGDGSAPLAESGIACERSGVRLDMYRNGKSALVLASRSGVGSVLHVGDQGSGVELKASTSSEAVLAIRGSDKAPWLMMQSDDQRGGGFAVFNDKGEPAVKVGANVQGKTVDSWLSPDSGKGK